MKRLIFVMVVMAVLISVSGVATARPWRTQAPSMEERAGGGYSYGDYGYGPRARVYGYGYDYGYGYGYGGYGYGYRYGPVYDRFEYTHTAPGYKHHVYDRRSGGVITGIGEFLFGKRELDINIEEGYPSK